jgi:hypothetical protein
MAVQHRMGRTTYCTSTILNLTLDLGWGDASDTVDADDDDDADDKHKDHDEVIIIITLVHRTLPSVHSRLFSPQTHHDPSS